MPWLPLIPFACSLVSLLSPRNHVLIATAIRGCGMAPVVILAGHNYGTERFSTIENECARNLAFRCKSAEQFKILAGGAS